ncbi:DUF2637 domain-containing protein [Pseudonocardia sp.]|jgi:hypothetical protein|uniref:DUF2637 domain-containing protein n=1 Tax=Pseudonocardia sp. TaxID=60912 RepID=UPI003D134333
MTDRKAADRGPVPRWVQVVTVSAVAVVAVVAAVASYVHMHQLASGAGEGWRAILVPLSVDGMLVAASMVMFVRRREGLPAGLLPWVGLVLGIVASLAANVAAGQPTWRPGWLPGVVAAWPPIALAIGFELLILVNRAGGQRPVVGPENGGIATGDAGGEPGDTAGQRVETADERAARLIAEGFGRKRLSKELGVTEHQARDLIANHRQTNGHEVAP